MRTIYNLCGKIICIIVRAGKMIIMAIPIISWNEKWRLSGGSGRIRRMLTVIGACRGITIS